MFLRAEMRKHTVGSACLLVLPPSTPWLASRKVGIAQSTSGSGKERFPDGMQSIPGATIRSVVRDVPTIGARAMYRGIAPAATGAFSSHGVRTCAYEAALLGAASLGLSAGRAQPLAAFVGTTVGTMFRIPCEVLKQQLQRGNYSDVQARRCTPAHVAGSIHVQHICSCSATKRTSSSLPSPQIFFSRSQQLCSRCRCPFFGGGVLLNSFVFDGLSVPCWMCEVRPTR